MRPYTEDQRMELGDDVYDLAASAFVKCARRDSHRAENFARVAWCLEPLLFEKRLWSFLWQDAARDVTALLAFYRFEHDNTFEAIQPLIKALTKARKSREPWAVGRLITSDLPLDESRVDSKILEIKERWKRHSYGSYDIWDFGVGRTNYDWLLELADRDGDSGAGVPYFFLPGFYEDAKAVEEEKSLGRLHEGWFPYCAVDAQTRPGAECIRLANERKAPFTGSGEGFVDMLCLYDGYKSKRKLNFSKTFDPYWRELAGLPVYNEAHDRIYKRHTIPMFNDIRGWYFSNKLQDQMPAFQAAYSCTGVFSE